ncbi:MAG: hypothetical protein JF587_04815 [Catenulisporales bacterium]|nr:hypothetical protein [Catenulisporales bacterium]
MRTTWTAAALAASALAVLTSGAASAATGGTLPHRAESTAVHAVAGHWVTPQPGFLGGEWLLFHRGDTVTVQGRGYFVVRWEIEYWRGTGVVSMPTFTGQQGTFLHVASAGHPMDMPVPKGEPGQTWMGKPSMGFETLPAGTPMVWLNEYYYVDGTVTITCQEAENGQNGRYNVGVAPKTWQQVDSDVHPPKNGTAGLVLDPGPTASPSTSASVTPAPSSAPRSSKSTAPRTPTTTTTPRSAPPTTTAPVTPDPATVGTSATTGSTTTQDLADTAGSAQPAQTKGSSIGLLLAAAGCGLAALIAVILWRRRRRDDTTDRRAPCR